MRRAVRHGARTGEQVFLTVRVTQDGRNATGTWPAHTCTGTKQRWSAVLRAGGNKALQRGSATGQGSAIMKRHTRTVARKHWNATVTLR